MCYFSACDIVLFYFYVFLYLPGCGWAQHPRDGQSGQPGRVLGGTEEWNWTNSYSPQASTIIALWQNLLPYDQLRVAYSARHQSRLTTGRFRCSKKKPEFMPGVESMTRCVLGSTGSPAQWPDSCRLVECIFVKLCDIHKSPKKISELNNFI